ncbi:F-box domain containing protein [Parasponia andersonii]|uniref:F-box domain containing protein n=1 Tax=Parasponia andersonii TaxID=3476 RepID=A0A2P5DAR7_PARAD|nr:F-box domain containing protein [Parasponia andersonii]
MAKFRQDLPEEIVEEILIRLSPESLTRFKRVCKSWYALIKDPAFINKQHRLSLGANEASSSWSVTFFLKWTR